MSKLSIQLFSIFLMSIKSNAPCVAVYQLQAQIAYQQRSLFGKSVLAVILKSVKLIITYYVACVEII